MSFLNSLTDSEKEEIFGLINAGQPLPEKYRNRLFPPSPRTVEVGKEYRLYYDGKAKREQVLADTPPAPLQLVRRFCTDRPFEDGWHNLLIWGDNLYALRELLADQQGPNRLGTRDRIKLVYIDPPFATRQDFMKDKEKAYLDKVVGSEFIEFLRRRLILLREILADDGCIFVHLDTKKGHYIKAVMDEIFDETNFRNEIIWKRQSAHNDAGKCGAIHDTILFYSKTDRWIWNDVRMAPSTDYLEQFFDQIDPETGKRYARGDLTAAGITKDGDSGKPWRGIDVSAKGRHWAIPEDVVKRFNISPTLSIQKKLDELDSAGAIHWPRKGVPRLKRYADEVGGVSLQDVWTDIKLIHNQSKERVGYPTQKPEEIAARIIQACSNKGDIVLDAFAGSGTVPVVAEKLGRRWIAIDSSKLAMYTTQKRLFSLTTAIGSEKKDNRIDSERVIDWNKHLKAAPGILFITEKARKGECDVTQELIADLAALVNKHRLLKMGTPVSLICPREKFLVPEETLEEIGTEEGPGEKQAIVDGVTFRISFIEPKEKTAKEEPLLAREFAMYQAGLYNMNVIKELPWNEYRPFVLKLFNVREQVHSRYGLDLDGYINTHSTLVWNYPEQKRLTLDYGFVESLHQTLRGKPDERFYIIAPSDVMDFAEDEVNYGGTTYVFLKVPLSVLRRLLEKRPPSRRKDPVLPQPMRESDVNEVIDTVGFDFIFQPKVKITTRKEPPQNQIIPDYVLEIEEFRSQTMATDPEDFANFKTFSMAMIDFNYLAENPEDEHVVFHLDQVYWADDLIKAAGGLEKAKKLTIRIPEEKFTGDRLMVILCDRYGNEKKLVFSMEDFNAN